MRLKIEDFGQHKNITLDSGKEGSVLFVIGKNRVGKSTVRDAIEFALLGSCEIRGCKTKKEVGIYMIREGRPSATVTLHTGRWAVRRSITKKGSSKLEISRTGSSAFEEVNATEYHEFFRVDAQAVRCALDSEQFFDMDEKERRQLLISIKDDEGIDAQTVWEALGSAITSYADEAEDRKGTLRAICQTAATLGFARANDQATNERRAGKRALAEVETSIERLEETPTEVDGVDIMRNTLPELKAHLETYAKQLADMTTAAASSGGSLQGQLAEVERAHEKAKAKHEEAQALSLEYKGDPVDFATIRERKNAAFAELESANLAVGRQTQEVASLEKKQTEIHDELRGLASPDLAPPSQCPAVSFKMKCPVKGTTFEKAHEKAGGSGDARTKLDTKLAGITGRITEEQAALERCHEVVTEGEVDLEVWRALFFTGSTHATARKETKEAFEEADQRLVELRQEIEDATEGPTEDDIEALKTRIALGEKIVQARMTHDTVKAEDVKLQERKSDLSLSVSWWDEVEKLLRPDGIEAALAKMATSRFSEILKQCDPLAEVRVSDAMDVTVNGHNVLTRSKSERLCAGISIQSAMAWNAGLDFLVIDEMDKLDEKWKKVFHDWVQEARTGYSGGVMALATSDVDPPGIPPDGFITAWLHDGKATMLGGDFDG